MAEKFVFRESRSPDRWNDVTIIPSLLVLVSRFCTLLEVKFHVYGTSKHGEYKLLSNKFVFYYTCQYIVEILSSK